MSKAVGKLEEPSYLPDPLLVSYLILSKKRGKTTAENKNVENAKIDDIDLDKVAGGITDEEFDAKVEEIAETAKDAYKTL